jgi:hypothetical protein
MGNVMTPQPAWPLQTRLPLAALPTAPSVARGHVRAVAREWGLAELAETAETLSKDWGSYHEAGGKVVWAMITANP